jgi:hypothetical protein
METTFSNGFLASDQQPDDVARSTARDAGKQPSRFQLPKLFTDGETETHAPSTVTSTEPGINYTYYRVKTEVHKPQQESSPQPEVPPTAASQHVIVAEAVAMPSAEQTIMAEAVAVASASEPIIAEAVAVSATDGPHSATAQRGSDEMPAAPVKATEATSSTHKSRFRMPRLFADTQELSADELKEALKEEETTKHNATQAAKQRNAHPAPVQTADAQPDDGVTYTYYRGIKTAVNRPGTQPNLQHNSVATTPAPVPTTAPALPVADAAAAMVQTSMPTVQPVVQPAVAQPSPENALLHEMEQLRAGMMEMSRHLQEMQQMQQQNGRKDNEPTM